MRILVISNLYPPDAIGGHEIRCGQVCEGLAQCGHDVYVLTREPCAPVGESGSSALKVERSLQLTRDFSLPPLKNHLRTLKIMRENYAKTKSAIESSSPDVVFLWSQRRLTVGSLRAVLDSGIPFCHSMGDDYFVNFLPQRFRLRPRAFYRFLWDRLLLPELCLRGIVLPDVHFISDMLRREVIASGVAIERSKIIYRGLPLSKFPVKDQPGLVHTSPRLLYAGALTPAKGVLTLLEAVEQMEVMGHRPVVTIVGSGSSSYEEMLRKKASSLDSGISFLGRVQHADLPAIYRANDILVFPSIWNEPFGVVHLEAMASGTPVVATIGGGQDEFLVHDENALTFEKEDARGLTEQILRLVQDSTFARDLSERARQCVEQHFSYDDYIIELERLLENAVRAQGGVLGNQPKV